MMTVNNILAAIDASEALERYPWCENNPDAIRSAKKEIVGEKLLSHYSIFAHIYNERAKKITDLDEQKSGIDYKTYSRNIDIKVSIGDFRDDIFNAFECIPVEIRQNGKITFSDDKATTDVLFINMNLSTNKIYFISVPYDLIKEIVKVNTSGEPFVIFNKLYIREKKESYNKSGIFIKLPIKTLFDYPGVLVQEYAFDENILNIFEKIY